MMQIRTKMFPKGPVRPVGASFCLFRELQRYVRSCDAFGIWEGAITRHGKLYRAQVPRRAVQPQFEHDNCGIGAVVDIKGRKSHQTIDDALQIVEHLEHRAGKDAEGKTGDGVGILTQISDKFFQKMAAELGITLGKEREYGIGMFFSRRMS